MPCQTFSARGLRLVTLTIVIENQSNLLFPTDMESRFRFLQSLNLSTLIFYIGCVILLPVIVLSPFLHMHVDELDWELRPLALSEELMSRDQWEANWP